MKRSLIFIISLMFFLGFTMLSCSAKNNLFSDGAETESSEEEEDQDVTKSSDSSSTSQYSTDEESVSDDDSTSDDDDSTSDDDDSTSDDDEISLNDDEEEILTITEEAKEKCKYFSKDLKKNIHGAEFKIKDYTSDPSKYYVLNDNTISFSVPLICKTSRVGNDTKPIVEADIESCQFEDYKNSSVIRYEVTYIFTITNINASTDCDNMTHVLQVGKRREGNGCFDPETRIRSIEGREVPIKLLNKGDKVFNPLNKKFMTVEELVVGPEELPMVEVQVAGKVVKVSSTHAFITKKGQKMAMDVNLNDEIALEDGKTMYPVQRVSLVLPVDKKQQVYNIKLKSSSKDPKEHAVLANGVVSGDLFLQSELERKAGKTVKADKKEVKKDVKADKKDLKKEEAKEVKKEEVKK